MLMRLQDALHSYRLPALQSMARLAQLELPDRRKETVVNALITHLSSQTGVMRAYARLQGPELAVLQKLQAIQGEVYTTSFYTIMARTRGFALRTQVQKYAGGYFSESTSNLDVVLSTLMQHGLVLTRAGDEFRLDRLLDLQPGAFIWIADEVRAHLPPLPENSGSPPVVRGVRESSARVFQRDLFFYWSQLRIRPLSPTKTFWLRKNDLRLLNDALLVKAALETGVSERDSRRLFFLRRLLQELDMLSYKRNQVIANPKPDFLEMAPAARVEKCFHLWREGRFWNELYGIATIILQTSDTPVTLAHAGVVRARKTVLDHLQRLPQDAWVMCDTLISRIHQQDYEFLLPRSRKSSLSAFSNLSGRASNPYYQNVYGWQFEGVRDEQTGWYQVEGEFILAVLREGLYWMGLIDLGYAQETPGSEPVAQPAADILAYRLTNMGRWLLGTGPVPQINVDQGRVIVQPNFDVLALDPITDAVLAALDQFCDRLSADRAIHYRLSQVSVYRGSTQGWDAARIIEFLQTASGAPLPQNVERELHEWAANMQRIVIRTNVSLLQAASPSLLAAALQLGAVAREVIRRPSPDVALLNTGAPPAKRVLDALRGAGYASTYTLTESVAASPCLTITPAGVIAFREALPNIFLLAKVEPFCEQNSDGAWQVTAAAVANAVRSGWTGLSILDMLRSLHIGPLPAGFDLKVKAWAGHFGTVRQQTMTILRFDSSKILEELMANPEVGPLLKSFLPRESFSTLAMVEPKDAERLHMLLQERGVVFKNQLL